jgi:DNA-binding NarL/FixJ family response regulator
MRLGSDAMEAQPIRVLLVDDDASFLNSLEALLVGEPGLEIVGKAAERRRSRQPPAPNPTWLLSTC